MDPLSPPIDRQSNERAFQGKGYRPPRANVTRPTHGSHRLRQNWAGVSSLVRHVQCRTLKRHARLCGRGNAVETGK
jgi:hypothetical protein